MSSKQWKLIFLSGLVIFNVITMLLTHTDLSTHNNSAAIVMWFDVLVIISALGYMILIAKDVLKVRKMKKSSK